MITARFSLLLPTLQTPGLGWTAQRARAVHPSLWYFGMEGCFQRAFYKIPHRKRHACD